MRIVLKPGWAPQIIAATGQTAEPGVPVDVDDALGASLVEQVDKWAKAKPDKPKPKVNEGTDTVTQEQD